MFKRCCFSRNASARSCFLSRRDCSSSRHCATTRSNSFCACRAACRDPGDLVNTCNLERRLEVTSSSLATFSLLILSDCMQSLIAWVPSWTDTSFISSTPPGRGMSTTCPFKGEVNQRPVELRLPQLRLHWCQREATVD